MRCMNSILSYPSNFRILFVFKIQMEKDIYLTETFYYSTQPNQNNILRQKSTPYLQPNRTYTLEKNKNFVENLPLQNYYQDKKVKPGVSFYKTILDIEEKRANGQYNGPHLNLNIPETVLLNDNSNSMIYTVNGMVKVEPFVNNEAFLGKLQLSHFDNTVFPLVVHSSISGINFNNSIMMSNEIVRNKIIPRSEGFICKKFIRPYSDTPNLMRLYYIPKSQRTPKKNYAYKMVNKNVMNQELFKKKHRNTFSYLVNPEKYEYYTMTLMKGKSLDKCQQMSQSLTEYFQKGLAIKITELILDFVVDNQKTPWLLEVKSIKSRNLTKLWDIGNSQEIELLTEKNNNSQLCRLCGMMYCKNEMNKLVTNKLLWQLIDHLKARGIPFQSSTHLKKEGLSFVCDVCYQLIVAQHQLVDIQKQFSSLLNITPPQMQRAQISDSNSQGKLCFFEEEDFQADGKEPPKLKAWRLFFYLERIKNYQRVGPKKPSTISLQMSFKPFKQTFTKFIPDDSLPEHTFKLQKGRFSSLTRTRAAKLSKKSILLQKFAQSIVSRQSQFNDAKTFDSRLNDNKKQIVQTATTMFSKITSNLTHSKEVLSIEKVKVFVFYTKKHQYSNIFAHSQMQFHLKLDNSTFQGRSLTLQELKNKDTCQRHSSEIFLFNQELKYCNLELTVGLTCDGEVEIDQLALQEVDGIFYHKRPLTICKPLPDEWMEVFTRGEQVPSHSRQMFYDEIKTSKVQKQKFMRQRLQKIDFK